MSDTYGDGLASLPDMWDELERLRDLNVRLLEVLKQFIRRDGHGVLCHPWEDEDNECLPSCIQARATIGAAKGDTWT